MQSSPDVALEAGYLGVLPGKRSTFFLAQSAGSLTKLCICRAGSTLKGHLFLILYIDPMQALPLVFELSLPACFRTPSPSPITLPHPPASPGRIWKSKEKEDWSALRSYFKPPHLPAVTPAPSGLPEPQTPKERIPSSLLPHPCPESSGGRVRLGQASLSQPGVGTESAGGEGASLRKGALAHPGPARALPLA